PGRGERRGSPEIPALDVAEVAPRGGEDVHHRRDGRIWTPAGREDAQTVHLGRRLLRLAGERRGQHPKGTHEHEGSTLDHWMTSFVARPTTEHGRVVGERSCQSPWPRSNGSVTGRGAGRALRSAAR